MKRYIAATDVPMDAECAAILVRLSKSVPLRVLLEDGMVRGLKMFGPLDDVSVATVSSMTFLRVLEFLSLSEIPNPSFFGSRFWDEGFRLEQVERMTFQNIQIDPGGLPKTLLQNPIQWLGLWNCGLSETSTSFLRQMQSLKHFSCSGSELSEACFAPLQACDSLQSVAVRVGAFQHLSESVIKKLLPGVSVHVRREREIGSREDPKS